MRRRAYRSVECRRSSHARHPCINTVEGAGAIDRSDPGGGRCRGSPGHRSLDRHPCIGEVSAAARVGADASRARTCFPTYQKRGLTPFFGGDMKIYDLSQPLNEQFPFWPYYPPFEVKYIKRKAEHGVNAQYIMTSNHMGTHLDAPRHFVTNGKTIDEIPIEWCYGPG